MAFTKRQIWTSVLKLFGDRLISFDGPVRPTSDRKSIRLDAGVSLRSGLKTQHSEILSLGNSAITVGIAVAGNTQIKGNVNLTAAEQTITTFVAQPDVPRTIRLVSSAGCGDGTFVGANARICKITGTDTHGNVIHEWIPLNAATPVDGVKAFATVTSAIFPIQGDGADTLSLGYGPALGISRPIAAAADVIECGRKATAVAVYTTETLGTSDVGELSTTIDGDQAADDTTIVIASGTGWTNGAQRTMAEIIFPDGEVEEVIITSRTTVTLTVVRGANGSTARKLIDGLTIALRPGMTYAPNGGITANDRFKLTYISKVF